MSKGSKIVTEEAALSIGALSQATGVPVGTLRSWEQRYGFPVPERRESGHRRYGIDHIERIRLIKRALDSGNRASEVVGASAEVLQRLSEVQSPHVFDRDASGYLGRMMSATLQLDENALDRALGDALDELGVRPFIQICLLPFLREIGVAWSEGRLGVMHEHFASDRIRRVLDERRRPHRGPPTIVCAALPGEQHALGLHIGALLMSVLGLAIIFLGPDTPVEDIAGAVVQREAQGVLVGSSRSANNDALIPQLASLRRIVAPRTRIGLGGATHAPEGIDVLADFVELEAWAARFLP